MAGPRQFLDVADGTTTFELPAVGGGRHTRGLTGYARGELVAASRIAF